MSDWIDELSLEELRRLNDEAATKAREWEVRRILPGPVPR